METTSLQKEKKPRKPKPPKVQKDGSTIREMLDEEGNRIIATDKGNVISLDLKLKKEKRRRHIGLVTKSTRTLFVSRKRGEHLHLKSNSYGFNYTILEKARSFDFVSIQDEYRRWKIKREDALDKENQSKLFFKQQGFELQIFISLEKLTELSNAFREGGVNPVF